MNDDFYSIRKGLLKKSESLWTEISKKRREGRRQTILGSASRRDGVRKVLKGGKRGISNIEGCPNQGGYQQQQPGENQPGLGMKWSYERFDLT